MPFLRGRFVWKLSTVRESMSSSVLSEKNCEVFPLRCHFPTKTNFLSRVRVGVLLTAYRQTDKFLSHNENSVLFKGPLCLFVYELLLRRYFTLKVPKIYSVRLLFTVLYRGLHHYMPTVSKRCTASGHRQRTRISVGGSAEWLRILVLLQASAYIAVVIGTTATFLDLSTTPECDLMILAYADISCVIFS